MYRISSSHFPTFLQFVIWGLFFTFPCIYYPNHWAWTQSARHQATLIIGIVGWVCIGISFTVVLGSIAWLGIPQSVGRKGKALETSGPYHMSRNPQMMGGVLIITGYVILWPSWYTLGWVILFAIMAHMMVLTEEDYLRSIFRDDYKKYCEQVPRYLGLPRKS